MQVKIMAQAFTQIVVLLICLHEGAGRNLTKEEIDILHLSKYQCKEDQFCEDYPDACGGFLNILLT